ncbi:MAG: phosphate ABC transporter permease subunit PstC [Actinomycetota bacterium]|nr:phosphate ABC transporter permease subunit PstC [Actinomycetota bacterium]
MTTTEIRPDNPPAAPPPRPTLKASSPRVADKTFRIVTLACGLAVLAILALIAVFTTNKALPAFRVEGLNFLTSRNWNPDPARPHFGGLDFIFGTFLVSVIALTIAVPISLGLALFLTEVAPRRLRLPVVYLIDLLAAIPSVVFGLWGILALQKPLGHFYGRVSSFFAGVPVLDRIFRGSSGRSFFTAGLIVAMMITPIITSLTREVFATVPSDQKGAALALGATRWEMMRTSILGYGRSGVVGAVMLGLGRAMGETIAVALVIGSIPSITLSLFHPGDAMAAVIANQFGEAQGNFQAALIGLGVVLFALTIVINMVARSFVSRTERAIGPA